MFSRTSLHTNLCASWAAHAVTLLAGFFLMPYVLHTLGNGKYGTWIFINSVTSYAALMYLGFGTAIRKFVATYHARGEWDKLNQAVNVTLAVYAVMSVLAPVSYTHLRAHETGRNLVCRLLLEKKKK